MNGKRFLSVVLSIALIFSGVVVSQPMKIKAADYSKGVSWTGETGKSDGSLVALTSLHLTTAPGQHAVYKHAYGNVYTRGGEIFYVRGSDGFVEVEDFAHWFDPTSETRRLDEGEDTTSDGNRWKTDLCETIYAPRDKNFNLNSAVFNYWNYGVGSDAGSFPGTKRLYRGSQISFDVIVGGCSCTPASLNVKVVNTTTGDTIYDNTFTSELVKSRVDWRVRDCCWNNPGSCHTGFNEYLKNLILDVGSRKEWGRAEGGVDIMVYDHVNLDVETAGDYSIQYNFTYNNAIEHSKCTMDRRLSRMAGDYKTRWHSNDKVAEAYILNMSVRPAFSVVVKDYDTYGGGKDLLGEYTYEGDYVGSLTSSMQLALEDTLIGIAEDGTRMKLGVDSKVSNYYDWYYFENSNAANNRVQVPRFGTVVIERYMKPVEYDIYLHENIYNVNPEDATYDASFSGSGWTNTGKTDTGIRRGKVYKKHFVYGRTKMDTLPTSFGLQGWTPDTSWFSKSPKGSSDMVFGSKDVNISTSGVDVVDSSFTTQGSKDSSAGKDTGNRVDLYTIWSRNDYIITYDCALSSNAKAIEGGVTKRTETTGVDGTTQKVTMDKAYSSNGTLKTPQAYWKVELYPHGTGNYMVGTLDISNKSGMVKEPTSPESNKNFYNNVYSSFDGWFRQKSNLIHANFVRETVAYSPTQSAFAHDASEYEKYSTDNYRKISGSTKMTIPGNHTLFATWRNNSIVLGKPDRSYTVTFHGVGGTYDPMDGLTVNGDTASLKHTWLFEGWGTRECLTAGSQGWGSGDCRSGQVGIATSIRTHIESDASKPGGNGVDPFTPTSNCKVYAHWEDPGLKLPVIRKPGYEFIGWYQKPQQDPNGDVIFDDGGRYYGGGDTWDDDDISNYKVTEPLHLYAWYNRAPIFVDIYEGLFFEGQRVSYADALELIGVYDYEDNYNDLVTTKVLDYFAEWGEKVDNDIHDHEEEIDHLEAEYNIWVYEHPDSGEHIKENYVQAIENARLKVKLLLEEKELIEQEREKALQEINRKVRNLEVRIAKIQYFGSGTTVDYHYTKADGVEHQTNCYVYNRVTKEKSLEPIYEAKEPVNYDKKYIETQSRNIGKFDITYQVRDDGIWYTNANGDRVQVPDSDITLEYTRRCRINFNYNPVIKSQNMFMDSSDSSESGSLAGDLMKAQAVIDSEDVQDNIPWWRSGLDTGVVSTLLLHQADNDETVDRMNDSLCITGIKNYTFASAFETEHPDVVQAFRAEFTSPELDNTWGSSIGEYYVLGIGKVAIMDKSNLLDTIYAFSQDNGDYHGVSKKTIWHNLVSMDITFDAVDQWGKWASNHVSAGQYRSMTDPNSTDRYDGDPDNPDPIPVPWGVDTDKQPGGFDDPENTGGYDPDKPSPDPDRDPNNPDKLPDDTGEQDPENSKPNDDPNSDPKKPDEIEPNPEPEKDYPPEVKQDEPERTIKLIIVSKNVDLEVNSAFTQDNVRFISPKYLNGDAYVSSEMYERWLKSYWGSSGSEELTDAFNKNNSMDTDKEYTGETGGTKVYVNDLTSD